MLDPLYKQFLEERIQSYRDRMEREYITVSDAAEFLGVHRLTMSQLLNESKVLSGGEKPFYVSTASLARFKQERAVERRKVVWDLVEWLGLDDVDAATYLEALREAKKQ